jgi:hypothetical protein
LKILTKLLFLLLFISKQGFCVDIQYFLSPFFFKNPQSYQVNGSQNVKYNLGELFSKAIEQTNNNFYKCRNNEVSDAIINLHPITFYNPGILQLQTDIKIRVYSLKKNIDEFTLQEKEIVRLSANSEHALLSHYKSLARKISQSLSEFDLDTKIKLYGEICSTF